MLFCAVTCPRAPLILLSSRTDQVLELLSTQIAKIGHTSLDAIILVGGFSASEYLYTRVRQAFGADVPVVVRPQDCDTATLRGAARYGLGLRMGRGGVSSVISPRSYCMKSKLPAEEEDHWRRPEYVTTNDGGTVVCENRLSCESVSASHWTGSRLSFTESFAL